MEVKKLSATRRTSHRRARATARDRWVSTTASMLGDGGTGSRPSDQGRTRQVPRIGARPLRAAAAAAAVLVLVIAGVIAGFGITASSAAPTPDRGAQHPVRIVWPGYGVEVWRASGQMHRLAKTSPEFRALVRRELNQMFHGAYLHSDPACAESPLVIVKEYRRRGFAYASNAGTFGGGPGHAPDRCASGGAWSFFVRINGTWRAPRVLGGQEAPRCRALRRFNVPRMSGAKGCYNTHGEYVDYHG